MADEGISFKIDRKAIAAIAGSDEIEKGLKILGGEAEREAKVLVPVDTGNLRRSITHRVAKDRLGWFMEYGTNVYYGIYQELGTRHHPAHPFLRPVLSYLTKFLKG